MGAPDILSIVQLELDREVGVGFRAGGPQAHRSRVTPVFTLTLSLLLSYWVSPLSPGLKSWALPRGFRPLASLPCSSLSPFLTCPACLTVGLKTLVFPKWVREGDQTFRLLVGRPP